jgi:hypothetical protein
MPPLLQFAFDANLTRFFQRSDLNQNTLDQYRSLVRKNKGGQLPVSPYSSLNVSKVELFPYGGAAIFHIYSGKQPLSSYAIVWRKDVESRAWHLIHEHYIRVSRSMMLLGFYNGKQPPFLIHSPECPKSLPWMTVQRFPIHRKMTKKAAFTTFIEGYLGWAILDVHDSSFIPRRAA